MYMKDIRIAVRVTAKEKDKIKSKGAVKKQAQ